MAILVIREQVTPAQLRQMLEEYASDEYVKLAVDLEQGILAGGGEWHADCEAVLLELDCDHSSIWGAGWLWQTQQVTFDSLINIRPKQGNRTLELEDLKLRERVQSIVIGLFAGVNP